MFGLFGFTQLTFNNSFPVCGVGDYGDSKCCTVQAVWMYFTLNALLGVFPWRAALIEVFKACLRDHFLRLEVKSGVTLQSLN